MKIATFKAECNSSTCRHDFSAPALSDFSYGAFIYSSIDSKEIRYYCGLNCETWTFIDHTVSRYLDNKDRGEIGRIIQKTIGLVADRQNPGIPFTQDIYCPKCHSKVNAINFDHKTGAKEYEDLTFRRFNSLNALEKKELIYSCISRRF